MTIRGELLDEAKRTTEGDRNETHGDPYPMMDSFAEMLTAYLHARGFHDVKLYSFDSPIILQMYKLCRIAHNPEHKDSHIDNAAYGAIAWECVVRRRCPDAKPD